MKKSYIIFLISFFITSFVFANTETNKDEVLVKDKYYEWCKSIAKAHGDSNIMTRFYAHQAILLPTLSEKTLSNKQGELDEYFKILTSYPDIQCTPKSLNTRMYKETAINSGLYLFSYKNDSGKVVQIPARFTFVYHKENGDWLIIKHHSSKMPKIKIH